MAKIRRSKTNTKYFSDIPKTIGTKWKTNEEIEEEVTWHFN